MKQKTAMQEMFDFLISDIEKFENENIPVHRSLIKCAKKAKELLELEEKQLKEWFNIGRDTGYSVNHYVDNKTYKQD